MSSETMQSKYGLPVGFSGPPTPPEEYILSEALVTIDSETNTKHLHSSTLSSDRIYDSPANKLSLRDRVTEATNSYMLKNWTFTTAKARANFLAADFAGFVCISYSSAYNFERLTLVAELCAAAFLIDDVLEQPGGLDHHAFVGALEAAMQGCILPGWTDNCATLVLHDIFCRMRDAQASDFVDAIAIDASHWLRATIAQSCTSFPSLTAYFIFRYDDVAAPVMFSAMRFLLDIRLTPSEFALVHSLERNAGRHITASNDLRSWHKEYKAYLDALEAGFGPSPLCNAVHVLCEETAVDADSAKATLEQMMGAWERRHLHAVTQSAWTLCSEQLASYVDGLSALMQGHKAWCLGSKRYDPISDQS